MPSYEPSPTNRPLQIECRGCTFKRDSYRGMWWRSSVSCRGEFFIGAEHNLPKDVLKKLIKLGKNEYVKKV